MDKKQELANIEKLKKTGMTVVQACEKLGIRKGNYYYWKKKLHPHKNKKSSGYYKVEKKQTPQSVIMTPVLNLEKVRLFLNLAIEELRNLEK
jgi:hypothetical protein